MHKNARKNKILAFLIDKMNKIIYNIVNEQRRSSYVLMICIGFMVRFLYLFFHNMMNAFIILRVDEYERG